MISAGDYALGTYVTNGFPGHGKSYWIGGQAKYCYSTQFIFPVAPLLKLAINERTLEIHTELMHVAVG